jgi:hypothetical protein
MSEHTVTVAGVEYRADPEFGWVYLSDEGWTEIEPYFMDAIPILTALAAAEDEAEAQCNQRIKLIEQNAKLIDCARHYASVQGAHNQMPLEVAKRFTKRAAERLKEIEG